MNQREAFEAWLTKGGIYDVPAKDGHGNYKHNEAQCAWQAWQAALASQWQPISTAPKDGTEMILSNGVAVQQGWWIDSPGGTTEYRDVDGNYVGQHDDDGYLGWWDVGGGMLPEPTHWQPLPPEPAK
jgi:hypothetical protein